MADQTKVETSVVDTEVIEAQYGFDLKKALNTKGFVEFLVANPDVKESDMTNAELLGKKFETFEIKDKVAKGLKELYGGQIKTEMGITLDSQELTLIDKHIEKIAISNPEKLQDLFDQQTMFTELPKQVKGLEDEFTKLANVDVLGGRLNEFIKDKANLDLTANFRGVVGGSKFVFKTIRGGFKMVIGNKEESSQMDEVGQAHKELNAKFGKFKEKSVGKVTSEVEAGIAEIEATIAKITDLQKMKEGKLEWFGKLRKTLLSEAGQINGLSALIHEKVTEKFKGLLNDNVEKTVKSLESAQELLEKYKTVAEKSEMGINPFKSGKDEQMTQRYIDSDFTQVIGSELNKAIRGTSLGDNALTRLENALKPIIEKKKIGSNENDKALEVVIDSLNSVMAGLPMTNEGKAKRFLLNHILSNLTVKK